MLNEMFAQVFGDVEESPEMAILHDSEDVIDPRTFGIYAAYAQAGYDFIQVPVFSLNRGKGAMSRPPTWTSSPSATPAK